MIIPLNQTSEHLFKTLTPAQHKAYNDFFKNMWNMLNDGGVQAGNHGALIKRESQQAWEKK